jgi:hypothetical protein
VVQTIHDPGVIENLGNGEYLLKANLEVADDVTFELTTSNIGPDIGDSNGGVGLQYLKIAGANGIVVYGRIEISGVKTTSWDPQTNSPIPQTVNGSIPRAYINLRGSEGGFVHDS